MAVFSDILIVSPPVLLVYNGTLHMSDKAIVLKVTDGSAIPSMLPK